MTHTLYFKMGGCEWMFDCMCVLITMSLSFRFHFIPLFIPCLDLFDKDAAWQKSCHILNLDLNFASRLIMTQRTANTFPNIQS